MTVLGGKLLRDRLMSTDNDRLVVSPLLEPDEQLRDDQGSVDVRLGFEFAFVAPSAYGSVDEFASFNANLRSSMLSGLYRRQYIPLGSSLSIHPHQFLLASTLEYLRVPSDLMAYVVGRSTWGRLGLIVATAVGIQPRFAGSLTLELRNLGETPLQLYPGQTIAQLFFHKVDQKAETAGEEGQYIGAVDLLPKRLSSQNSFEKLQKLKQRSR